ncbi:MAG TPA: glycosyltransferase family 2 protein [Lutibacter sp.]|nr:glycosyltransferase family 2 protein [Lutibacter sp.]
MQDNLVSILLCTFNGEKYIDEQIKSILNQTYKNIELIIVDDLSTDNTYKVCKKYNETHQNIRLFQNETNIGINRNFEKAINLANGKFLAFSDQDDIWDLKKIEILVKLINKSSAILVYCNSEMIDEGGKTIYSSSTDHNVFVKGENSKKLILYNTVSGHQMLFKRKLLKHILPLPNTFWYDWWIAYIALDFFAIHFTEQKLVKYRIHKNSFVQTKKEKKSNRKIKIKEIINNLKSLYNAPNQSNKLLIKQLITGYETVLNTGISFRLLYVIILNRKTLLFPRIRPSFSLFKRIRNYLKIGLAYKHLE